VGREEGREKGPRGLRENMEGPGKGTGDAAKSNARQVETVFKAMKGVLTRAGRHTGKKRSQG